MYAHRTIPLHGSQTFHLIASAKVKRKTMQNKIFFRFSRATICHYTYSPFSLYTLYVQAQKKRAEYESVRLKTIF